MSRFRFDAAAMKRRRIAAGKPTEQVAIDTGRTNQTIQAYEAGRIVPPTPVLAGLCDSLGCRPEDLLRPSPEPEPAAIITEARKRSRRAQGLPEKVTDPAALDEAAELLRRRA